MCADGGILCDLPLSYSFGYLLTHFMAIDSI